MPLELRWLSFAGDREPLRAIRRAVFVDEQGFGPFMVETARDGGGLHLAALDGERVVAAISAYVLQGDDPDLASWGIDARRGAPVVQITKRASLRGVRGGRVSELLVCAMWRAIDEVIAPAAYVATLIGAHAGLAGAYERDFGLAHHAALETPQGRTTVLVARGADVLRRRYAAMTKRAEALARDLHVTIPSLVRFLDRSGRTAAIDVDRLNATNNYLAPLSLREELPRLAAQARIVALEQRSRLGVLDGHARPGGAPRRGARPRLLDVGCGPGVYLSSLTAHDALRGYEVHGVDASAELVTYARLACPGVELRVAGAYATGYAGASFDVVHASFLFTHLSCPDLALREAARLLLPGGLLYVVDVDDATFDGPPALARLVERYGEVHGGDRRVMDALPARAAELGLHLARSSATTVVNRGDEGRPALSGDDQGATLAIGRMQMWGIFSFMGQRSEIADAYAEAERRYFEAPCDVAVAVRTHVYEAVVR